MFKAAHVTLFCSACCAEWHLLHCYNMFFYYYIIKSEFISAGIQDINKIERHSNKVKLETDDK